METQYIDKSAIKQKVQEKLLDACERHYEAERALCEIAAPQSWKDDNTIEKCNGIIEVEPITFED